MVRRGTVTSVNALIKQIRDYVEHWNTDAQPFVGTVTADEILAKVRLIFIWPFADHRFTQRLAIKDGPGGSGRVPMRSVGIWSMYTEIL